jgi:hypothetical protein
VQRHPDRPRTRTERLRAVPWALLLQSGVVASQRWRDLSAKDRARLSRLLRDSRGLPGRLTADERAEVRRLVTKLDLTRAGRELLPLWRDRGRRGR